MKVTLCKVTGNHTARLVSWRNENKEGFPAQPDFTASRHERWYWSTYCNDPSDHYFLVMCDQRPIGTVAVNSRTREIGRVLRGEKGRWCDGAMTAALSDLTTAFGPGRYWLRVLTTNEHAITFYERLGFAAYATEGEYTNMEVYR